MGGHGIVIASIYFTALLLTASYVYADSVNRVSLSSWDSIKNVSNIEIQRLSSGLSIESITVSGRNTLYLTLMNTGNLKVVRADFPNIDILLTYIDEASVTKRTYWVYYDSPDTSKHRWTLNSEVSPNPSPSSVNPLDWDPSETLAIVINLPSSGKIKKGTSGYVSVSLPSAVSAGRSFTV
jgi:hypothetical protein